MHMNAFRFINMCSAKEVCLFNININEMLIYWSKNVILNVYIERFNGLFKSFSKVDRSGLQVFETKQDFVLSRNDVL